MSIFSAWFCRRTAYIFTFIVATAAQAQTPANPVPKPSPLILFIIGENEYHTWETLPRFAEQELAIRGLNFSFALASPKEGDSNFSNFDQIKDADLIVISVRRRTPPKEMLALLRKHLNAGKPLVALRTASHAFGAVAQDAEHEGWPTFDGEILGCKYENHFSNTGPNAKTVV